MPTRIAARESRKQRYVRPAARRLPHPLTRPRTAHPPPRPGAPPAAAAQAAPAARPSRARPLAPERAALPAGVTLTLARQGDLTALPLLFASAGHGPSPAELSVQWDAPEGLAPRRVLAQKGTRVVGHIEFSLARLCSEGGTGSVALLRHLAMLPEHARPGLAAALLAEAEEKARACGAATAIFGGPGEPAGAGWRLLPAERRWLAPAARLVARLESLRKGTLDARPRPLIRPWRLVELDALMRIYSARAAQRSGACFRDEAGWNWLLNRQAHDRIYLALEGQDRGSFADISGRVRAYLTLRGRQVVELAAERGHEEALLDLLTRACGDALEETAPLLVYCGAADDPLGALFGWAAEHAAGHALPQRWIKPLAPEGRRVVEAFSRCWRPPVWDELEAD